MKRNHYTSTDPAESKTRKKRLSRAEKKAAKMAVRPIHKRPVVCPTDKAGRSPLFRAGGLLCRALVIWLAAAGLVIFVAGALEFGVSNSVILLTSLAVVLLGTLFGLHRIGRWLSAVAVGGSVIGLVALRPTLPTDLYWGVLSLYNAALDRLYRVGYLTYVQYKAAIGTSTPTEELMVVGVCLVTVLITMLFTACLSKRVKLIPPAIVATTLLVVILTFNIYSNRIESNLGITLVMVSFASVLVLAAYERIYRTKDDREYDTELRLFEDNDRPTMPPAYTEAMSSRAARREAKAALRTKRREHTVTVDEELTDYFSTGKTSKKKKTAKTDAIEAAAEKRAHREMMKEVRAVKSYDRVTEQSRTAMGGYAAAAVLLACLIAIALPATLIKGNFNTIDAIDEKMSLARDYVTALLRGDDDRLDRLEYEADNNNFEPHSTTLEQLEFTGKQILYVQSRYNTNYYLRGWVGTDYEDGAWLSVDEETLDAYHELFGEDASPAEEMRYYFYHYMKPELVDDPDYFEGTNLLTKYKANLDYGFVALMVSLRRVNSPSSLTYFPTTYATQYGIFEYNALTQKDITFVNYYDGLYTGRRFDENKLSYGVMTYAPVMTNRYWIENQAVLEAAYNLQKEALLARSGYAVGADGQTVSYLTLMTEEQKNGMTLFVYTYKRGDEERIWRFYHATDTVTRDENRHYFITTDYGTLTLRLDGGRIVEAFVSNDALPEDSDIRVNLTEEYEQHMTDADRTELMTVLNNDRQYSDFVYKTYLDTSDSTFIKELAATIKAQAHTEVTHTEIEEIPDDPETPEDDSYTTTHRVTVDTPVDVSLAALRNASEAEVYIQRDCLVRNVIDYIITEMACTYTITPDLTTVDASLDGVENFLINTKEGYCVQFASAAALILRELGIPTRYVEGYIAGNMTKISREDFVYGTYVHDYEAHAWIEVYFDGIGWIQYETTPQYYAGMYGTSGTVGSTPTTPVLPDDEETDDNDEPVTEPDEPDTAEDESTEETTDEEDAAIALINRNSLIGLGVLVVIGAIAAVLYRIISRARAAEDHRASVAAQVLESGFGQNTSESDRREMALEMTDAITNLLTYFDLSPKPGEFRDDYADRLTVELTAVADDKKPRTVEPLPNLHAVMGGMAAEEFGHGMSIDEMKLLATLYLRLRREIPRRIAWPTRLKLHYVKRKI